MPPVSRTVILHITDFLLLQGAKASFHIVGTPPNCLVGYQQEPGLAYEVNYQLHSYFNYLKQN